MPTEIKQLADTELDEFVEFPYTLFRGHPQWIGELKKDTKKLLSISHPFWLHGERVLFMAYRDGQPAGRIAAIINRAHNSFHGENCGFFGFFDCEDNAETARQLFFHAENYLRSEGMNLAVIPSVRR